MTTVADVLAMKHGDQMPGPVAHLSQLTFDELHEFAINRLKETGGKQDDPSKEPGKVQDGIKQKPHSGPGQLWTASSRAEGMLGGERLCLKTSMRKLYA